MGQKRLQDQIAWISGGASGMGQATAELFAAEGAKVAMVDVQEAQGQAVVERIQAQGGQAIFFACDVGQETQVQAAIAQTVAQFGGLQIIVNCAGLVPVAPLHEYTEREWDHLMGVNLKAIFFSMDWD